MECPFCKTHTLNMIKADEEGPADGYKCMTCARKFVLNFTHDLVIWKAPTLPLVPAAALSVLSPNRSTAPEQPSTHTAALLAPAPVKKETLEKAAQIAEKSLKPRRGGGRKPLPAIQQQKMFDLLVAGKKVVDIQAEIGCSDPTIYKFIFDHEKSLLAAGMRPRKHKAKVITTVEQLPKAPEEKPSIVKVRPPQVYNNHQGNVMSQMARLQRGELRPQSIAPVLLRYKAMMEAEVKVKQSEIKELKRKISVTDKTLHELDVMLQGEKAAIDKVLVSVRKGG